MAQPKKSLTESGAQYMQPFSNFIGNMVNVAKEKMMGDAWWLPSSNKAVVEIPNRVLKMLAVVEQREAFTVYKSPPESSATVHVAFTLKDSNHVLSLCRCADVEEALDILNTLSYYTALFAMIDCRKHVESLLRCIKHHSLWQPVHIAAMLGMKAYFESLESEKDKAMEILNRMCQPEGRYPLHIAVESCHVDLALYMMENLGVPVGQTDVNGQNIFHYAARTTPVIITTLAKCPSADKQINVLSKDGYTPLFLSVSSCKPTCAAALIKQGAVWDIMCNGRSPVHQAMVQDNPKIKDLIKTLVEASPEMISRAEPQTGNSALHVAASKQTLLALLMVCRDINLEMRNFAGQTALHLHVQAGNLGCVTVLVYSGADINAQDMNGDTCLHIAVSATNLLIAKALLVLGADPNLVNKSGDTARHVAARLGVKGKELLRCLILCGAKRCDPGHAGCTAGCSALRMSGESELSVEATVQNYEEFLDSSRLEKCIENVKEKIRQGKRPQMLLTLDGGGVRGLILVQILLDIESRLKKPISSYIDWVAGTSTGSFVAVGLAQGKTLRECQLIYLRMKDMLFERKSRPYDTEEMELQIKAHVGESSRLEDFVRPKVIITTVLAEKHPVRLHLFRSYRLPGDHNGASCSDPDSTKVMPLWKMLRCSSAAPTYFSSVDSKFVDGGLIANNPSLDLLAEVQRYNMALEYTDSEESVEMGCLLSIGTGRIPDTPIDCLDVGFWNLIDVAGAVKNLSYMIMDQVTATEGRPVDRARAWCFQMGVPFFRFSTQMTKDYVIDSKSDSDLVAMMWDTVEYMAKKREDCQLLVDLMDLIASAND